MTRQAILALGAAWLAVSAHAGTAVGVEQVGGATFVTGEVKVPATAREAWAVLTDYGRYAEIVPGMRASRLIGDNGGIKIVEQAGEMRSGNLRLAYVGTLHIQENPPDNVRIHFASGTFRNALGEWKLKPVGKEVVISYRLRLDPSTPYPPNMLATVAPAQVQSWVDSFAAEMAKNSRSGRGK